MTREEMIHKLTLADTSYYRMRKVREIGKAKKEPVYYRSTLYSIYDLLPTDQIEIIIKLKEL